MSDVAEDDDGDEAVEGEVVSKTDPLPQSGTAAVGNVHAPQISVAIGVSATYASDLPPAQEVTRLEEILPGTLGRLLKIRESVAAQAVSEQTHRHKLETKYSDLLSRGQLIAASAFVLGLVATVVLALTHHDGVAKVVGGATLLGVVVVFVTGRVTGKSDDSSGSADT
jgi:uncharacterized membrane protein